MFRVVPKSYLGDRPKFPSPNVSGLWDKCPADVVCNCIRSQNTSQEKQPQRDDNWINLRLCCLRLHCCWRCFLHGRVRGTPADHTGDQRDCNKFFQCRTSLVNDASSRQGNIYHIYHLFAPLFSAPAADPRRPKRANNLRLSLGTDFVVRSKRMRSTK